MRSSVETALSQRKPIAAALALVLASGLAVAKVPKEEADRMLPGGDLTPMGAERAGNAAGTIPEWTGGLPHKDVPVGDRHENLFADDEVLFTIDASNYQQYAEQLSEGAKAMFERYPETFRMHVYPTRRSASNPQKVYDWNYENALNAELTDDGKYGLLNVVGGNPFPIPQSGAEAVWNHTIRYRSDGEIYYANQAVVETDGGYVLNVQYRELSYAYGTVWYEPERNNILLRAIQRTEAPPRLAGQMTLSVATINPTVEPAMAWSYNPGQRRVRRAPEYAYDAPTADGLMTRDQSDGYGGALDRYNWTLHGKKEMYIGYNGYNFQVDQSEIREEDMILPGHLNQDLARYELHRVWVVEANVKPTERHIYAKRVFYIDEDSWTIAQADIYDGQGNLWRYQDGQIFNMYTIPLMTTTVQATYDLNSGRYSAEGLDNRYPPRDYTYFQPPSYWTPQRLRTMGVR